MNGGMRMRARVVVALLGVLGATACSDRPPPVVEASEVTETPTVTVSPTADPDEARLVELRATDMFDEFAEHERAAKADGARLAWENFAPIVDGERVEWKNKAELWDSIAPKIRDEALLLGPEHREPLWNNRNAIPNGVAMAWNNDDTEGRGDYAEFSAAYLSSRGPAERIWAVLIARHLDGRGLVHAVMPPRDFFESDYRSASDEFTAVEAHTWAWVQSQEKFE